MEYNRIVSRLMRKQAAEQMKLDFKSHEGYIDDVESL